MKIKADRKNRLFAHFAIGACFNFSIEPVIVGGVRLCSYSELQKITDFKYENILRKTLSGRLFHGIIGERSEKRRAFVKTWDLLLPMQDGHAQLLPKFCDEIELFTDEKANTHQNLVKLCMFCCYKRLAAVYECDEKFTRLLSNVLLDDEFRWDDWIKVATQLADLLAFLHEKGTAVGCVTASCIMIDEEMNIKVFDFGYVSCHVNEDSKIPVEYLVGREAPEAGTRTMKSDVYIFGLLLLELITKKEFEYSFLHAAKRGKINLVDECFKEFLLQLHLRSHS
nr:probable serine/threonine-protein kinase PBL18 [Nicotiana tomentosiformis]